MTSRYFRVEVTSEWCIFMDFEGDIGVNYQPFFNLINSESDKTYIFQALPISPTTVLFSTHQTGMAHFSGLR